MLITESGGIFKVKEVWFADRPYDVTGCSGVVFREAKEKADCGFVRSEFQTLTIDLSQDLDKIMAGMDKKACRYEIKRAMRDGVTAGLSEDFESFQRMNRKFRARKAIKGLPSLSYLRKYGTLFVAQINGEAVAGQVYLTDGHDMRWLLGARIEGDVLVSAATRLLVWRAIEYAKTKGMQVFDFGGYHSGNNETLQKISFFKRSFGGQPVMRYNYEKVYSPVYLTSRKLYGWWKRES